MLAPMLVQMEREIDREISRDNKANGTQDTSSTGNEFLESDSEDDDDDGKTASPPTMIYGPKAQVITNDLKSLDEMVRELVEQCTCPSQFQMIRVSEGKYRIGDTKVLIFVRVWIKESSFCLTKINL